LNKRTSINSNFCFHKEKEMADFRKWLLAFAVLALLLVVGVPAHAQSAAGSGPAFICTANAGVTPLVRIEGVTETVGDVLLDCVGGVPTAANAAIPLSNLQVFLNTQITSRLLADGNSEATLTIDEPFPGFPQAAVPPSSTVVPNAPTIQNVCAAVNQTNCAAYGVGPYGLNPATETPAASYAVNPLGPIGATGPYNGVGYTTIEPNIGTTGTHAVVNPGYNVFQGVQVAANQVDWLGVPIDSPGSNSAGVLNTRVIRITNIRGNICNIASGASSFIPFPVYMYISLNGSQQITISNPQVTVAYLAQGLKGAISSAAYQQCYNLNGNLLNGATGQTGTLYAEALEGFASSFKVRTYDQIVNPGNTDATPSYQNVLGFPYNTESDYVALPTNGAALDFGLAQGDVGLADTGTEITFTFNNIGAGVTLVAPVGLVNLYQQSTIGSNFQPSGPATGIAALVGGTTGGVLNISGGSASVTYEVLASNVNLFEGLVVPIEVSYITTGPTNPAPSTTSPTTATINFAPAAGTNTTASVGPIPRFCTPYTAANFFTINPCTCNLLFPFVTNIAGFDTGIAIANTTADSLNGVAPQAGPVTLTYYGTTTGGGAAPATQVSQSIPAGSELIFTLYSGGNYGISPTPGFNGYIIARTNFQYCHAFAFISDLGAQKLAEGYLAIQLDLPVVTVIPGPVGLNRTGQAGENEGH
jgi:hypothetical protein